jgi:hypothetical protein
MGAAPSSKTLLNAACKGDVRAVEKCLKAGVDVNASLSEPYLVGDYGGQWLIIHA